MHGHWKLSWEGGIIDFKPRLIHACSQPALLHTLQPSMTGEASLYRVISNDDPAGTNVDQENNSIPNLIGKTRHD